MTSSGRQVSGPVPIVVGVDGSDASLTAVRYAATDAVRTGAALVLVHAAPELGPLGAAVARMRPVTRAQHRVLGDRILNRARRAAREITGDHWSIRTRVVTGPAARALAAAAEDARVLVIGHHRRSPAEYLVVGSVVARLAVRSPGPVVVVPDGWNPAEPHHLVVLGVDEGDDAEALLRVALATAGDRGARLEVVHAWDLPEGYDERLTVPSEGDVWPMAPIEPLDSTLLRVRRQHPHVPVELELTHGAAADVLVGASAGADLLVLGIHRHLPTMSGLGRTVRRVLRDAACPVVLVPFESAAAVSTDGPALDPELV